MSEVSTDKKTERKRPYYHRYLFRNLLCHQLCLYASGRYSPCSLDADAWLHRCVCRHSLYADGRKGSKTGCSFPDGAYHCSYLFCHRTIYPGDPNLDGFYLHFG